jgi:hypothetical protein
VRDRDARRRARLFENYFFDLRKKAKADFAKTSIRQILRKFKSAIRKNANFVRKTREDRRRMER